MADRAYAWLTPALRQAAEWRGCVHSAFAHAVNLRLTGGGETRLFTLLPPGVPRLPDAAQVCPTLLAAARVGDPAALYRGSLTLALGGQSLALAPGEWRGTIPRYQSPPQANRLRARCAGLPSGLSRLPPAVRTAASAALLAGDGRTYLGLGAGLTPAFDDACVGAMAMRRALGAAAPFRLPPLGVTTDVSARYLALAQEGYFGEPLCDAVAALFGATAFEPAVARLLAVGATSGADMLAGMALGLQSMGC